MASWRYRCYATNDSPNLWAAWYIEQSPEVQAKHDTVFEFLEQRTDWSPPHYKKLSGQDGLGEVILKGKVAWRIFGFRHSEDYRPTFTVTQIGNHKGNLYSPKNVISNARGRMNDIRNDSRKVSICDRPK
jgi:hypothetical protein